jgi:type IV pilus assembly protein PilC
MPFYNYRAKNSGGQIQRGKVEAVSQDKAAETLIEKGLFIINLTPVVENMWTAMGKNVGRMRLNDVVVFTRQLAAIVEAGLTLTTGLSLLVQQAKSSVRSVLSQLLADLEGGMSFSAALQKHPKVFAKSYTYLVQAGESSGSLDVVLNRLADTMEEQKEFKGKVVGALIYPIAVLLVMIAVVVVMMVAVIPKLLEVFEEFDAELPLPTKVLIAVSTFMTNYWWMMLVILAVLVMGFFIWYRGRDAKKAVDALLFKLPVYGDLRKKIILTNYNRTLSMLVHSGVSLVDSLRLASEAVDSINYRDHFDEIQAKIEKGVSFGAAVEIYDDFPMIMSQMIKVGEETGKLDDILAKLASYFKGESQRAVAGLMAAFEPLIMVILGLGVAFLVIAIIMPIYDLTNQISA